MDYKKALKALEAGLYVTSNYLEGSQHLFMDPRGEVFKVWKDEDGYFDNDLYVLPKEAEYEVCSPLEDIYEAGLTEEIFPGD